MSVLFFFILQKHASVCWMKQLGFSELVHVIAQLELDRTLPFSALITSEAPSLSFIVMKPKPRDRPDCLGLSRTSKGVSAWKSHCACSGSRRRVSTHPGVVDDDDLLDGSDAAKFVLKVLLASANAEAKHTNDVRGIHVLRGTLGLGGRDVRGRGSAVVPTCQSVP